MAQNTTTLRLVFKNQAGSNYTISLDEPVDTLTSAEIEQAMDLIIARNIISTSGGDLVVKQDIKIIDQIVNDLFDPVS